MGFNAKENDDVHSYFPNMCWQKYMIMKNGRYQINMDVLLFPWKLTYKNHGSSLIPKGSFGKVHLAQDAVSRKRMACKLVSLTQQRLESCLCQGDSNSTSGQRLLPYT